MNNNNNKKPLPVRLLGVAQVLGEDPDGAHDRLAHIKFPRPLDDALDDCVDFPAEHLVQRLAQAQLGAAVPRQDQLSVGALEHWQDGGEVVGGAGVGG